MHSGNILLGGKPAELWSNCECYRLFHRAQMGVEIRVSAKDLRYRKLKSGIKYSVKSGWRDWTWYGVGKLKSGLGKKICDNIFRISRFYPDFLGSWGSWIEAILSTFFWLPTFNENPNFFFFYFNYEVWVRNKSKRNIL